MTRSARLLVALAAVTASVGATAGAETFDERLPVAPGGSLEVDLDLGDGLRPDPGSLAVTSHDAEEVRIVAEVTGWGASDVRFRIDEIERRVRVVGSVQGSFAWMFGGPRIHVRIWVPRHFSVDVRTSAGPIRVEELSGRVRARARGAPIEVSDIEGDVRARTDDGDLRVREVAGAVELQTTNGDVEASWVRGALDARTERGDLDVKHVTGPVALRSDQGDAELRDVAGPVEVRVEHGRITASFSGAPAGSLETRHGSVDVLVPVESGFDLDARASAGTVELGADVEVAGDRAEQQVLGRVGGGGSRLRLFTPRGSVRLSRR